MKLHELAPVPGSKRTRTRLGRGLGSGLDLAVGRSQAVHGVLDLLGVGRHGDVELVDEAHVAPVAGERAVDHDVDEDLARALAQVEGAGGGHVT